MVFSMAKHLISVCIFCLVCATHSPCESHTSNSNVSSALDTPKRKAPDETLANNHDVYLRRIFEKYGDGKSMTIEGFAKFLNEIEFAVSERKEGAELKFRNLIETDNSTESSSSMCINRKEILGALSNSNTIDEITIREACPSILYNIVERRCRQNDPINTAPPQITVSVWFYSYLAVLLISACGILGLAVIPIMQKHYYQPLLQFLVALAVGTLAGDALLHLLPHAMSPPFHDHEDETSQNSHDENMWKGFVAMLGLVLFFVMERLIVIIVKWRKRKQLKHKIPSNMKVMKEGGLQASAAGEKQCKHKYSSMPFCYDAAAAMIDKNHAKDEYPVFRLVGGQDDVNSHNDTTSTLLELNASADLNNSFKKPETNQNSTECPGDNPTNCTDVNKMLDTENEEYTIILREHENRHHGHSHTHGHVHSAPKNLSSVVWMVILGDGLHNLTDGMAIGAAFSSSIAGGFSTAVAVFCHELPHEMGDFAMLLKAGMSMKQALFYNVLSSVLCLCGNTIGVLLGNTEYASSWVFAVAAGTFIYIALVDMMPELSNGHEEDGPLYQCVLQLSGLLVGFAIMTCIAVYEHDLKHIFREPF